MSSSLVRLLLTATVFIGPLSALAEDWDLKGLPPIKLERVFVSKTDRKLYVLIGEAPGGTFVLLSKNGQVRAPKQGLGSVKYFDGGSLDLNFESGERIMIPATADNPKGRAHSLGYNYLRTSSTPRIATPTTAPQELIEVQASDRVLRSTGFDSFIAKSEEKPASAQPERYREVPVEKPEEFVPVILAFNDRASYSEPRILGEALKQLPESDFRVVERDGAQTLFGSYDLLVVLVRGHRVDEVRNHPAVQALVANNTLSVESPMAEMQIPMRLPIDLEANLDATLKRLRSRTEGVSLAERYQIFQALEGKDFSGAPNEVKVSVARAITGFLGDVEALYARSEYFISYRTAVADIGRGAKDAWVGSRINVRNREQSPATSTLLQPLRQIGRRGFAVLHSLQHPLANEIIIEAASALNGAGFEWLNRKVKGSNKTYFQEYFDGLRRELSLMDQLPAPGAPYAEMDAKKLSMSQASGGMFENVRISGKMLSLRSYDENGMSFRLTDRATRNPLLLLGRGGDKSKLKQEVMQFIVDGDKRSYEMAARIVQEEKIEKIKRIGLTPEAADEYSRTRTISKPTFEALKALPQNAWLGNTDLDRYVQYVRQEMNKETGSEGREVKGHKAVIDFVMGLRWRPSSVGETNFSNAEYDRAVMEIYTDLLEQSRVVLTNEGVYVAVLDSAIEMVKEFERQTGLRSESHRNVAVAALRLQNEVQKQLLAGWNNGDGIKKVLNPNPPHPRESIAKTCEALFGR